MTAEADAFIFVSAKACAALRRFTIEPSAQSGGGTEVVPKSRSTPVSTSGVRCGSTCAARAYVYCY
ncbi:hypothetical protein EMIT0232MI5_10569 [Pseudomonas sp. IT-232MI5]